MGENTAKKEQELLVAEGQVCRALDSVLNKSQHLKLHPKGRSRKCEEDEIRATIAETTAVTLGTSRPVRQLHRKRPPAAPPVRNRGILQ